MDVKKVNGSGNGSKGSNEWRVKVGLAEKSGRRNYGRHHAEQARSPKTPARGVVMALERVPSDIRKEGGVPRMAQIKVIREIMATVDDPVMAKVRIGHFAEAEVLQALKWISSTRAKCSRPPTKENHIWKHDYRVPFVCGCAQFGRSVAPHRGRRGVIRTKGEGVGKRGGSRSAHARDRQPDEKADHHARRRVDARSKEHERASRLVRQIAKTGKLPVPNFPRAALPLRQTQRW